MAVKVKKKKEDKTFRVFAKVVTYCYHDIKAKNATDAEEKVQELMDTEELDGGDFITCDDGGEFIVATSDIPTQNITKGTHKKR